MIRKLTLILILATLGLSAGPASALFDNTVVSPRYRAMGESSVAVQDAAFAAFVNPAQMGDVDRGKVAATYVQPFRLDFTDFYYLGAGKIRLALAGSAIDRNTIRLGIAISMDVPIRTPCVTDPRGPMFPCNILSSLPGVYSSK